VVRGRIDAVFADGDDGFLLVDWKTNRAHGADPVQLAVYRLAWAELHGVPLDKVRAAFYYVRDGEVVVHDDLPGREELEEVLRGSDDGVTGGQVSIAASATSTM
jgi:DNA helicase II / ATP-dependent DNA helicase PcrA